MKRQIKNLAPKVRAKIEGNKILADDHNLLTAVIWHEELEKMFTMTPEIKQVLRAIATELSSSGTIRKTSRQLQKDNPELRGLKWKDRQAYAKKSSKNLATFNLKG